MVSRHRLLLSAAVAVLAFLYLLPGSLGDGLHFEEDIQPSRTFARGLKQAPAPAAAGNGTGNGSLILAAHRTARHDPLDHFHIYRDGWDIRNKHYWASVGFTGIPGFILALIWAFLGLLLLLFLCCWYCCFRRRGYRHEHSNLIPLIMLTLLALLAIRYNGILLYGAGCVLTYYGQQKFHNNLSGTLDYVVDQSNATVENLHNISRTLDQGSTISLFGLGLTGQQKQQILQVSQKLNSTSNELETRTEDNAHKIRRGINIVRIVMIVVSAVMLLFILLGISFTACGLRSLVVTLVVLGWLILIGTWILSGVFILLHNAMGDTCVAMEEWVRNPNNSTNLDDILPCVNPETTNQTLLRSREATVSIISVVNQAVSRALNGNIPPGTQFYINQSGPLVPTLCNPYGPAPDYDQLPCSPGTVSLDAAAGNWSHYVCNASNGVCTTTGRMTPVIYDNFAKTANVARSLYVNVPFLISVQNCIFVRDTFQTIINDRCPGLRKYTKYIWIGLILISAGASLSIPFWIHVSRRRHDARHHLHGDGYAKSGQAQQQPMYGAQARY